MGAVFISKQDLADQLERDISLISDAQSLIACDSACQILREESGQLLDRVDDEVVLLDCEPDSDTILLPQMPVVEVASVVRMKDSQTLVEGTDYIVDLEMGALRTASTWSRRTFSPGRQAYQVTYTHGWSSTTDPKYPSSLRMLALTVAARIYDQGPVSQETVGGVVAMYSSTEAATLTDRELHLLSLTAGMARR